MPLPPEFDSRVSAAEASSKWEEVVAILEPLQKGELDDDSTCRLGEAYWHLMKMKQAKELFEKVLEKNPSCARAWFGMASVIAGKNFMAGEKNYSNVDALQKAAELEPTNNEYVFAYTFELSARNDYSTEAAFFEKILKNNPDAGNYLYLSDCYLKLNQPPKAIEAIEHALKLDPTKKSAYPRLGRAYEALGKKKEAREAYETALKKNTEEGKSADRERERIREAIARLEK